MKEEPGTYTAMQQQMAAWLIDEDLMATAYEAVGPQQRALIKQNIARHYAMWGESPSMCQQQKSYSAGFSVTDIDFPAPFAMVVCSAAYAYPAALLAAIMPALCAGVTPLCFFISETTSSSLPEQPSCSAGHSLPCSSVLLPVSAAPSGGISINQALLCALELAGVESLYCAPLAAVEACLTHLVQQQGQGRLVLVSDAFFGDSLALSALQQGVLAQALTCVPSYTKHFGEKVPSAYSLALDTTHQHIFSWPQLSPAWFRNRHRSFKGGSAPCL